MLYPRIAQMGFAPHVYARTGYVPSKPYQYNGVKVVPLASIRTYSLETVSHTCLAVFHAQRTGGQIIHLHSIGPALWTPLAKRLGLKVVVTHHGFDYNRQKWGDRAKALLKRGEEAAIRHADGIICISREILASIRSRNPSGKTILIPNGVERPTVVPPTDLLSKWGLREKGYLLLTARFVREKGIGDLIGAWKNSGLGPDCALVIAGGEDHPSDYGREIQAQAQESGATLTGPVFGEELRTLYAHARGFVLPSFHEGLPISLLEAMSWSLPVVASSIEANREVGLPSPCYFTAGDRDDLAQAMGRLVTGPDRVDHSHLMTEFDWSRIAETTAGFYREILASAPRR